MEGHEQANQQRRHNEHVHVVHGVPLEGQGDDQVREGLRAAGVLLVANLGAVCQHRPLLVHLVVGRSRGCTCEQSGRNTTVYGDANGNDG